MLPQFNAKGNLPSGIYYCNWDEFIARFGITAHRLALIKGLKIAMVSLKTAGCSVIYVDGSFVTSKYVPGDFDACWDTNGVDTKRLQLIAPNLLKFENKRAAQKSQYKGEFFPSESSADGLGTSFLEFFQKDKDGNPKGIILSSDRTLIATSRAFWYSDRFLISTSQAFFSARQAFLYNVLQNIFNCRAIFSDC